MSQVMVSEAVLQELGLGGAAGPDEVAAALEMKRAALQRRLKRAVSPEERRRHQEALSRLAAFGGAEPAATAPQPFAPDFSIPAPLTRESALELLSLGSAASEAEIRVAYDLMRPVFEGRVTKASPQERGNAEAALARLNDALSLLVPPAAPEDRHDDLPGEAPSAPPPPANRESPLRRSQGLSLTQVRDLPGAAPFATSMKSRGGSIVATRIGLQPGAVLADRYEIVAQIGAGGMGAVYSAYDRNREEEIAIKVLLPELMENKQARDRFLTEAQISTKLSHPNIVKVFDVQRDGSLFFMTMELLQGRTLRQELIERKARNRPFDVSEVHSIARSLCGALEHAHQYTVHRDIKPENIWVSSDGTEKLMDFGIARAMQGGGTTMTMTGTAMGTAYYMAPEQLNGAREADKRADQYALAAVIYEMLTLEVPAGRIKSVRTRRSNVPMTLSNALDRALEANPEDRFGDIVEFQGNICNGGIAISRTVKLGALAAAAAVALVVTGTMVMPAGEGGIATLFARMMRNHQVMAQAEKARHAADTAQQEWERLRGAMGQPQPAEGAAALKSIQQGDVEFRNASDAEALRLFASAAETFQELSGKLNANYRQQALELQETLGRMRRNLEKAHESFETRAREAERAGGGAVATMARWRERMNSQVYDTAEFQQLAARMRFGEALLQDKKFADAAKALQEVRQSGESLLRLQGELDQTAAAEIQAEIQRGEWNKLAPRALLPLSDTGGPVARMIKAQALVNTKEYAAARAEFAAARDSYAGLLLKGQQEIADREAAQIAAEKAAQDLARRQAQAAAAAAQARAEQQRGEQQAAQIEMQRQAQERQMRMEQARLEQQERAMQAQREMQERQQNMQMMQGIFQSIGGAIGGARRY